MRILIYKTKPLKKKIQKRKEVNEHKTGRAHMDALARFVTACRTPESQLGGGVSV